MKKRLVGWPLLLLLAACNKPAPTEAPPRPALVAVVGEKSAASTMALVGEVRPRYESSQGFRIDGKIIERKVEVGSLVKKGQLIARLDPADSHLNVAAAQASVSAAEAESALALAELNHKRLFPITRPNIPSLRLTVMGLSLIYMQNPDKSLSRVK